MHKLLPIAFSLILTACGGGVAHIDQAVAPVTTPTPPPVSDPPTVASSWRFRICPSDGSQAYVIEANLDSSGNSVAELVFPVVPDETCTFPGTLIQPVLLPSAVSSQTSYSQGNFSFSMTQGNTVTSFSGTCTQGGTGGCYGTTSSGAQLTGVEYFPLPQQSWVGSANGSSATLTVESDTNQVVAASYQDGSGTYSINGQRYGGTVVVTAQSGLALGYFSLDAPEASGDIYAYGQEGSYLGTLLSPTSW